MIGFRYRRYLRRPQRRARDVLVDGERENVAVAAAVEVAGRRVMQRVIAPPLREGRERDRTGEEANDLVRATRGHERSVSAVVHDNERAHEESRGGNSECERQPVRHIQRRVHERDERRERQQSWCRAGGSRDRCCSFDRARSCSASHAGPEASQDAVRLPIRLVSWERVMEGRVCCVCGRLRANVRVAPTIKITTACLS